MQENGNKRSKRREETSASRASKDDPSFRSRESIRDKTIGSEGQRLAEKRLTALKRARQMASSSDSENTGESSSTSSSLSNGPISDSPDTNKWIQLGPTSIPNGQTYSPNGTTANVSGRITTIISHPTDANTIYLSAAQGGVWKTTNGGKDWSATSDNADSLAIGALAMDETNPNVLYAGTGEGNFGWDSQYGIGILKTTDGGEHWELKEKSKDRFLDSRFCRLVINPKKSSTIFAATISGGSSKVASGIYRSTDDGENWTRMEDIDLPPVSTYGATDFVLDPNNPDTAYAAFWGEGIFKTSNANVTKPKWKKLSSGLPVGDFTRIALGISKSSPNILYALMSNDNDDLDKFYQTNDGGENWNRITINVSPTYYEGSLLNGNNDFGGQGWYNINLAVHPQQDNIVYISAISLWKAIHNKNTNEWMFSNVGLEIHGDNHSFAFNSKNPETIYAGNDGGIFRSTNGGNTWIDDINQGLCITQFDFMEQHPTSESIILAGAQDNGTILYEGSSTFHQVALGDGGFTCIDPNQPNNVWHTYSGLSPELSEQGGKSEPWLWLGEQIARNPSNFNPPLTLDKTNSNNIAIGGDILYIDHSKGKDGWPERINLRLPQNDLISAINYVNSNLIYVGTNFGRIYRLNRHDEGWRIEPIHASPLPNRYIWDISLLPKDDTKLIVVVSGFGSGHVFSGTIPSEGGVATWTDITPRTAEGEIVDIPVNALVIDDNKSDIMYIGTDVGVFRTVNGGRKWTYFTGLPSVQVYDMRLHSPTGLLRVVTHGRGMWQRKVR